MRRFVFCFDGSWNGLKPLEKATNVRLVAEAVLPIGADGVTQIVHYDEGVGTRKGEKWRGGGLGKGLLENLYEAYRFLIFNYQQGDQIYIFGFSRGGFSAMAFAGLIRSVGILETSKASQISAAFEAYSNANRDGVDSEVLQKFRAENCPRFCASEGDIEWRRKNVPDFDEYDVSMIAIRYLGVWDSVGSLGWKVLRAIFGDAKEQVYKNFVTELPGTVYSARHAVSIDENRKAFKPTLWRNLDSINSVQPDIDPHLDSRLYQQKWFPGDHGSVGGGGEYTGLSSGALQWVLEGAAKEDLDFDVSERSQLSKIRYNIKTPLRNAGKLSSWQKTKNAVRGIFLNADRGAPERVDDLSFPALRMLLAEPAALDLDGKAYAPEHLTHLKADVAAQSYRFEPVADIRVKRWEKITLDGSQTLSALAEDRMGRAELYPLIFDKNRDVLDHPDYVSPGDQIWVPVKSAFENGPDT